MRKPYYKKSHKCWYVRWNGRDIRLSPDETEAFDTWASLRDSAKPIDRNVSFRRLAEEFLAEHRKDTARFNYDANYIAGFVKHVKLAKAAHITKRMIVDWLNADKPRGKWSQKTKRDAAAPILRIFRWAFNEGHLQRNPVAGLRIPDGKPRSRVVSQTEHRALFEAASPALRQYLIASRAGARPRQIREVTAENVIGDCWVFADHKTVEHTKKPLVVYMTPCLKTLTRELIKKYPSGPLFRTPTGKPWTKDYLGKCIRDLRGDSPLVAYSYRHTFATESLLAGNSLATVAELLGHQDARMVSRVYGHLDQHKQHLLDAAAKTYTR